MEKIENWKCISIDNVEWNYEISSMGRLRNKRTKKPRDIGTRSKYTKVTLFHKKEIESIDIHRLTAMAFAPNSNPKVLTDVIHLDRNTRNNDSTNLKWVTHAEFVEYTNETLAKERKSNKKPVLRYNLDRDPDNVVEYPSVRAASEEFGWRVAACLADSTKTVGGYFWSYKNPQPERVPFGQLDMKQFAQITGHPNYLISMDGRVYNKNKEYFMSAGFTGQFQGVHLGSKHHYLHRLVFSHFSGEKEIGIVIHKDKNKLNNHISNLEHIPKKCVQEPEQDQDQNQDEDHDEP
jgi:HNH endonuclease